MTSHESTVDERMRIQLVYLVGNGDLALPVRAVDAQREDALRELSTSADFWLKRRADHPDQSMHPLLAAINELEATGHSVVGIDLVATKQSPANAGDTHRIAEAMIAALPHLPVHPTPTGGIIEVSDLSVAGVFSATKRTWGRFTGDGPRCALTMATGATNAFVGLLLGALASGVEPVLIELNTANGIDVGRINESFSIERWLFRRRMWSSLVEQVDGVDKQKFETIRDQESLVNNRRAADNDQWTAQMAATLSALVAGSAVAAVRFNTALEIRLLDVLNKCNLHQQSVRTIIKKTRESDDGMQRLGDADVLHGVAKREPVNFGRVVGAVNDGDLTKLWNGGAKSWKDLYDKCTKHRHTHRTPNDWRGLLEDFINFAREQEFRDPTWKNIKNRKIEDDEARFGHCRTVTSPALLVVRTMGLTDNDVNAIDDAIIDHARKRANQEGLPVAAVVRVCTPEIRTRESVDPWLSRHLDISTGRSRRIVAETIRHGLRDAVNQVERDHKKHISRIVVAVSQGTKAINAATIIEALAFATELDASIEFVEAARNGANSPTTVIRRITAIDPQAVSGSLFGTSSVMPLLKQCANDLNTVQGRKLLELAPRGPHTAFKKFFDEIADPYRNIPAGPERLDYLGANIAILRHRYVTERGSKRVSRPGTEELFITQLSTLLSGATQLTPDQQKTGDAQDCWKASPALRPLWEARNRLFHHGEIRKINGIIDLHEGEIVEACATAMGLEPPTVETRRLVKTLRSLTDHD